jgi:hypothetical protein
MVIFFNIFFVLLWGNFISGGVRERIKGDSQSMMRASPDDDEINQKLWEVQKPFLEKVFGRRRHLSTGLKEEHR